MTPQELKASILQLAIQGKLVEQRPEEGSGGELLRDILTQRRRGAECAEKNSRAETPRRRGEASSASSCEEIPDSEKPFDIPESWVWVRLNDLVSKEIKRGKSPVYAPHSGTLVFAQKCNTKAGHIDLSLALCLDEKRLDKYPLSEFMKDEDIVINSTGNGTLGRVGIYHDSDNPNNLPVVPDSHVTVIRISDLACVQYVFYGLKHYQPYMEKLGSGSTNQTELSASTLKMLLFPLPPLAEQKRIVAKIEELLPLIDRYEKAWSKLEDFNKRFPGDMQKSLLQMAIQGKLVDQRAEEGTAAELLEKILAAKNAKGAKGNLTRSRGARGEKKTSALSASPREEIPDDEKPFDIPESWEWVRLESIINSIPSKQYQILESEVKPSGVFSVISQSKEYSIGFTDKSEKVYHHVNPVIVFGDHTAEVKFVEFDFVVGADGVKIFEPLDGIVIAKFLFYVLQFHSSDLSKVGGYSRHYKFLKDKHIPLPPLAEQKRIVAKLEELLPLCERLK